MNEDKDFLGKEPVGKLLLKLALPTVTAQIINMLYNIVDRIYIGHIPEIGEAALTGVGVCMPLIMIVTAFSAFAAYGGAPRASIYMGQGDHDSAEKTLGNCFAVQFIISVLLTAALLLWNRDFLMAFGASDKTIGYGVEYMNIYAIGTIFVQMTLGMNAFITAQGFARTGMFSVLIGAVANIVLDPIFIFGFNMGVAGAAWATIISQAMSCAWVLLFLCGKKTHLRLRVKYMRLNRKIVLPSLALGLSSFIMQASESIISICFNSSLQSYGGDIAVGAMTILTSVMQFAMLPLQGLTQGGQPIISYNYGAMQAQRVKKAFRLQTIACFTYSSLLWAAVELCPSSFVAIFTNEPQLSEITVWALRIYMAAVLLMGIQVSCQQTFIAFGNSKISAFLAVFRKIIVLIPLIFILPQFMQDDVFAVFLAEPIADTIAVITTATLFAFEFKKVMRKMQEDAHPASA